VALNPIIWIPSRLYERFQKIADREGVEVDAFVNCALDVMLEKIYNLALKHGGVANVWEAKKILPADPKNMDGAQ